MNNLIVYKAPFSKSRIGDLHDGGYVTVNLPGEYNLFISGGIGNNANFERDLLNRYPNLICIAFDGTINSLPVKNPNLWKNRKINFIKKNLGNKNTTNMTNLCEYMEHSNNIFMKIDIEGHEFRLMPTLIENNYISKIKHFI